MKQLTQLVWIAAMMLCASLVFAADTVEESGKTFPTQITVAHDGVDHTMSLTGVTTRKKFVIKVYAMAHYMADPQATNEESALKACLTDGQAKQITMTFNRGVGADKIIGAYRDGFKKNATDAELKDIQPLVDQFADFYKGADVEEDDQYILRWLPGGVIVTVIKGEEKPAITNETFARILWSIWLGEDSIVKPDALVSMMVK